MLDGAQPYCSTPTDSIKSVTDKLSKCTDEIKLWMSSNEINMNREKSAVFLCCSKTKLKLYYSCTVNKLVKSM